MSFTFAVLTWNLVGFYFCLFLFVFLNQYRIQLALSKGDYTDNKWSLGVNQVNLYINITEILRYSWFIVIVTMLHVYHCISTLSVLYVYGSCLRTEVA